MSPPSGRVRPAPVLHLWQVPWRPGGCVPLLQPLRVPLHVRRDLQLQVRHVAAMGVMRPHRRLPDRRHELRQLPGGRSGMPIRGG